MDKNRVSVEINGSKYKLVGEHEEAYYIRLGNYVDKSIKNILRAYKNMSERDAAVMAALTIADELLRMKDENEEMGTKVQKALDSELVEQVNIPKNKTLGSQFAKDTFIPKKK